MFHCSAINSWRIWRRYGRGKHPYPCRTRRLRPGRPMVLHWRRCGRAGGRQNKKRRHGTHLENRIYESIYKKLTGRLKAGREAEDKMRRQKIGKTSEELFERSAAGRQHRGRALVAGSDDIGRCNGHEHEARSAGVGMFVVIAGVPQGTEQSCGSRQGNKSKN